MLKRIIFASLAASFIACAGAAAEPKPPTDMVWKTADGRCQPSDGDIDGCSFGPAASVHKTGFAYFRVCGQIHEVRPFLIVDLTTRTFVFDAHNGRPPQAWPFRVGLTSYTPQDVADFAAMIEDKHVCLAA